MMTVDPVTPPLASVAVMVHDPGVLDAVYVLVTCPRALVLPASEVVPHEPKVVGDSESETGSSKATPELVVTVIVNVKLLMPLAVTLIGLATTLTAGGGGAK
jgi:hypothetical protein